jgi:demethylmenaquinone methyltransferase/2-methoxy-6-polyprenyl-1,4-benzoquinol methylase
MTPSHSTPQREKPEEIQTMFDAIAPTYDLLNHVLSFGLDIRWRRKAITLLAEKRGGSILDIAAGSGDVSFDLLRLQPRRVIGGDFSLNMLQVFNKKINETNQALPISLASCDALSLPFNDGSFDGTIVAFGIRNFADRLRSLQEMLRVLTPGGISVILELTQPQTPLISQCYSLYSRWGLPLVGKIISRSNSAYSYLPQSITNFPPREEFLALMNEAGFTETQALPLTFGVATIFSGRKKGPTRG